MEEATKGAVTSLSSLFTTEEAEKAAKRVEEKIQEKHDEINRLKQFIADNSDLINLVKRLPDQLHHHIMVPFGEAAFFPGHLIRTNEFLVLLGENHFVERTSKQTVEILKRRGNNLASQVDFLKANIQDLKAEASFFGATASEVSEGLVEIREDYVEEPSAGKASESGVGGEDLIAEVDDEEHKRIMARLDELEMEELADESGGKRGEDRQSHTDGDDGPLQSCEESSSDTDVDEEPIVKLDKRQSYSSSQQLSHSNTVTQVLPHKHQNPLNPDDWFKSTGLAVQKFPKVEASSSSSVQQNIKIPLSHVDNVRNLPQRRAEPEEPSSQAFTGFIIERASDLQTNIQIQDATSSQATLSQPSKPISRFKMRRR